MYVANLAHRDILITTSPVRRKNSSARDSHFGVANITTSGERKSLSPLAPDYLAVAEPVDLPR